MWLVFRVLVEDEKSIFGGTQKLEAEFIKRNTNKFVENDDANHPMYHCTLNYIHHLFSTSTILLVYHHHLISASLSLSHGSNAVGGGAAV